jgi:hypothetical protein
MVNSKKRISNKLKTIGEALKPKDLETRIDDLVDTTEKSLEIDEPEAKEFVAGMVGEVEIVERAVSQNQQQFMGMVHKCKKTGDCASEAVRKAAKNMSKDDAKDFASTKHKGLPEKVKEDGDVVGRGIEYGMNPEVEGDKYEAYRALMQQLAGEENEKNIEEGNDPIKLKSDVAKVLAKLDMSSIEPYLAKIDNPSEQAEMIAQFAEKIGVPKTKLSSVIQQLRTVSENTAPKKRIIRTVKVKDIK